MASSNTFTSIPILSLAAAREPATKQKFLDDLLSALLHVGFLYLDNTGIPDDLTEKVCDQTRQFFDENVLPLDEKEKIEMKNEKSFLGWSRLDNETTAGAADHREQLDLSTPHPIPPSTAPLYHNLLAPNQWPSTTHLPSFRPIFEDYMTHLSALSTFFTSLIAEALGMPPTAFNRFFDSNQQHKLKIVKYPESQSNSSDPPNRQGVGPHKDSMLISFLLQASHQAGLQAQNLDGQWIDAVPIPGTLVVAFGQGLEAVTGGVCASTTHRVLSPRAGEGARYSVPFFQGVSYDARFEEMDVPKEVRKLREEKGRKGDDVEFTFRAGRWGHLGEATLANRCKSHPDVAERWYPELLAKIREEQAQTKAAKAV
ncbi:Clavaminate synthase-like protein [Microthyrium microscopicum]|uniref:Clavaminate synthase-like protein n=1 Tax=Microthyrium microscopicum TaxID=703497 RepID=A0A6A6U7J9_9PEZI|nr:Clavaminate synthase-like protein [Microthyrium microscopicum]